MFVDQERQAIVRNELIVLERHGERLDLFLHGHGSAPANRLFAGQPKSGADVPDSDECERQIRHGRLVPAIHAVPLATPEDVDARDGARA
jgi:hypothetical protein